MPAPDGRGDLRTQPDKSPKSHGCLALTSPADPSLTPEEHLLRRPKWIPRANVSKGPGFSCTSASLPFCSAMDAETSNRYAAQYIALHSFSKSAHSGSAYHAVSTCAVLVVGAGGLGSPVLMYLAASGVGTIGIIDGDAVEVSNLHRQIIHDEASVGLNKARSARDRLLKINPRGRYIAYEFYLGVEQAREILPLYDVVVDASDNPQTKYLINDACILYNKPYVIASCIRGQGQLMVFNSLREADRARMPCFRCICPHEGNPSLSFVKNACSAAGVLGSIPGVLGTIQATEVLKLCAGTFDASLSPGRLLIYDAANPTNPFRTLELTRNRNCKVCGDNAGPVSLEMYPSAEGKSSLARDELAISPEEFRSVYMEAVAKGLPVVAKLVATRDRIWRDEGGRETLVRLVDVRAPAHFFICHLPGSVSWPLDDILDAALSAHAFRERLDALTGGAEPPAPDVLLLTICRRGNTSRTAAEAIRGFLAAHATGRRVSCYSVAGGMHHLSAQLGGEMPRT